MELTEKEKATLLDIEKKLLKVRLKVKISPK
jgi:hypothetical protein